MESDSDGVRHAHQKLHQLTLEPVLHSGGLRPPRAREVWSQHRRGNAASRAKKRQLHGKLCKPTCHFACSARFLIAIRGVLTRWPKHSQTFWSPRTNDRQFPEHILRPSTRAKEFRVNAFFSLPGCLESHPIMRVRSPSWRAVAMQHTHHGGVNGHLGPSTHGQTVEIPSKAFGAGTSMSRIIKFVRTRPPTSLQVLAMTLSSAYPRRASIPACAQGASSGRPHRQAACRERENVAKATEHHHSEQVAWDGRLPVGRCHM